MAFADLQPNQMVSEADAATGGFSAIGPKLSPANKCYTKAEALAAYSLDASAMSSYANNQLVPKSTWVSGSMIINFLPLGNSALNGMGGFDPVFSTARTVGTQNDQVSGGASDCTLISGNYGVDRMFMGFDTTSLTSVTNAGIQITLDNNQLPAPNQFVVVKTNSTFPANHAWVHADFNEGIGGTIVSSVVTVNNGQSGTVQFPFNATGLSYVNANNSSTFVVMQYPNDYNNVAPTTSSGFIYSFNTNMKLYYYTSGGGVGTGTCKCVFNGSNYVFEFTLNTGISGTAVTTNGFCTANQGTNSTSGLNTFSASGTPLTATFRSLSSFNNGSSATMVEVSITLDFNGGAQIKTFKSTADIVFTASEITAGTIKNIIYDQIT